MYGHSDKQYWKRRALLETYGQLSPAMEKHLERDKVLEQAREKVGDPEFDRAARRRYWVEFWGRLLFGTAIGALAIVSYVFIRVVSEPVALAVTVLSLMFSVYLLFLRPQTCGACRGVFINRFPIYCLQCGETYLFHKAGRWLFKKSQARISERVSAYREEKYGYQDRLLVEADKIASRKDSELSAEEISRLEAVLQDLANSNLKK